MSAVIRVVQNRIPELAEQMQRMRGLSLTFGYQGETGDETYASGLTVATNAAIQEFGAGNTPARPFMRRTLEQHGDTIKAIMTRAATRVTNLQSDAVDAYTDAAIDIHGLFIQTLGSAQEWAKPNAPRTIKAKGHDVPLKGGAPPDDGPVRLLLENLSWAIRINGDIVAEGR